METAVKYKKKAINEGKGNELSIFLVDDDLSYLYPLAFYLQRNHAEHKVYCYTCGEECLQNMHHHTPDIIILDFNLNPQAPNKLNGLEVLKEVKSLSPKTRVVMLSGRDTFQGVVDSLKLGAHTYVIKDIEALSSLKKIIDAIGNEKSKSN
ncbi:MAG: response regulator [Bacteroidia bacterium]